MISKVRLENFKCFEKLSMDLKNVTVLTGINGMGKSTIIQAFLLLHQSWLIVKYLNKLYIKGKYIDLGTAGDILYEKAEKDSLKIAFETSGRNSYEYQFMYTIFADYMPLEDKKEYSEEPLEGFFGNHIIYLSAYRIEPRNLYGIIDEKNLEDREFGTDGEYAVQYLNLHGEDKITNRCIIGENQENNSLIEQIKIWLDRIAPGAAPQVFVNMQLRTSELRYEFTEGKAKTNSYRSVNVGFGITYVLPLLIAILTAKEGDVLFLENPEAHIHPSGQRMLGELIALAGAGGVQILVETHSDHIINGIRIAVKQKKIVRDDVQLAFFYKDEDDDYRHKYVTPQIMEDGRLDIWPEGFFDEWDKALYDLM